MNAANHFEAAIKTDQGAKYPRNPNPDTVSEGAPFDKQMRPPSRVWPAVLDGRNFEAFIDGAGI
jgi:hypothetical protein